ncbi:MAG: hypothetical protein HQK49_02130 [Oligoflexia bacterium]|nr:hypothetical protein [Oligoflexia bacterium]
MKSSQSNNQESNNNMRTGMSDKGELYDQNNLPLPRLIKVNAKINKMGMLDVWTIIHSDRRLYGGTDQMLEIIADCGGKRDVAVRGLVMIEREKELRQRMFMQIPLAQNFVECNLKFNYGKIPSSSLLSSKTNIKRDPQDNSLNPIATSGGGGANEERVVYTIGEYCFKNGKVCSEDL